MIYVNIGEINMTEMKQINVSIPEEIHAKISLFNTISPYTINMTRVCQRALEKEINTIDDAVIRSIYEEMGNSGDGNHGNHHSLPHNLFDVIVRYIETNPDEICGSRMARAVFDLFTLFDSAYIDIDMQADIDVIRQRVEEYWERRAKERSTLCANVSHGELKLGGCWSLYPVNRFTLKDNCLEFFKNDVSLCTVSRDPEHYKNPFESENK